MQTLTSPPTPPHLPSLDLPPAFGSSFQPVPPPPQPRTIDKSDIRPRNSYPFTQQQQHSPFQHGGGAGARWNGSERGTTAGLPLPSSMLTLPPGVTRQMASLLSADKFKQIVKRAQALVSQGLNTENIVEFNQLQKVLATFAKTQDWAKLTYAQRQQRYQQAAATPQSWIQSQLDPCVSFDSQAASPFLPSSSSSSARPRSLAGKLSLTSGQRSMPLSTQSDSWKALHRQAPPLLHLQSAQAMLDTSSSRLDVERDFGPLLHSELAQSTTGDLQIEALPSDLSSSVVAGVQGWSGPSSPHTEGVYTRLEEISKQEADPNLPYAMELDRESGIFPHNSYVQPLSHFGQRSSCAPPIVPSLLPTGIDPYALLQQQNAFAETRVNMRIGELEATSTAAAANETPPQLQSLIELKSLKLIDKQRKLREDLARSLNASSSLASDRTQFRHTKPLTRNDHLMTEGIERSQRLERKEVAEEKRLNCLKPICDHAQAVARVGKYVTLMQSRLGKEVVTFHATTEKEEQKRVERLAKERLRALKNDDEEGYLKLIDKAKDTRITHLIRQTDSYLDSLAQAVVAQQKDVARGLPDEDGEEEQAHETMFGGKKEELEPGEVESKVSYYAVSHQITEKITQQPSILVGGTLKEYQLKGLQWMVSLYNNRLNGILADEMGLGKTIQTLALITYLIEFKRQHGPYLIVVPLSTITNWTFEFEKWAPSISVVILKGNQQARRLASLQVQAGNFQVLITTFEYIIREKTLLGKIKWLHMIIDEGHRMKNAESKLSQTFSLHYTARYRLILTGTPLQNNLPELWSLLNFVLPKVFNSSKSFDDWFNTPFASTGSDKIVVTEEEQLLIIRRLHKVLRPFLLRRLKKDVESELPDKVEKIIKCKMSALQQRIYSTFKQHGFLQSEGNDKTGKSNWVRGLNNTVMQLRKICNHPFVLQTVEDEINPSNLLNDSIWRTAGKFEMCDRILPKLFATGHRVLMFFQMVNIMNIFEDYLIYRGYKGSLLRLDGSTGADDRTDLITKFNAPDSPYKIFILSTRAGGLGLNLQSADTVIIYDSDWNPHADLQAQDRAHRIGQKKVVKIFRLVTNKSIEEDILATAQGKLAMDSKVIQAGKFDNKSSAAEQEAFLRSLLEAEADEGDEDDNGEMADDEINEFLARGEHELPIFQAMDAQREKDAEAAAAARGGVKVQRLMQDDEVPELYRREVVKVATAPVEDGGRGGRARPGVSYSDGLTEGQFLQQFEIGADDGDNLSSVQGRLSEFASGGRIGEPVGKKRKGGDANEDSSRGTKKRAKTDRQKLNSALMAVWDGLVSHKNPATGLPTASFFIAAVNKKAFPTYHQIVKKPVWLNKMKKQVNDGAYKKVDEFWADMQLLVSNAFQFNERDSPAYLDAQTLHQLLPSLWATHVVGSGLPGAPPGPSRSVGSSSSTVEQHQQEQQPRKIVFRGSIGSSSFGAGRDTGPLRVELQRGWSDWGMGSDGGTRSWMD